MDRCVFGIIYPSIHPPTESTYKTLNLPGFQADLSDLTWDKVWNMQYLDGGHWDVEPQKCVFGEVYQKVMSSLKDVGALWVGWVGWGFTLHGGGLFFFCCACLFL